jgi:hypothetical protein
LLKVALNTITHHHPPNPIVANLFIIVWHQ